MHAYARLRTPAALPSIMRRRGGLSALWDSGAVSRIRGGTTMVKTTTADELIDWMGGLTTSQGLGQPFDVMRWQKQFVAGAFAQGVQVAVLTCARWLLQADQADRRWGRQARPGRAAAAKPLEAPHKRHEARGGPPAPARR